MEEISGLASARRTVRCLNSWLSRSAPRRSRATRLPYSHGAMDAWVWLPGSTETAAGKPWGGDTASRWTGSARMASYAWGGGNGLCEIGIACLGWVDGLCEDYIACLGWGRRILREWHRMTGVGETASAKIASYAWGGGYGRPVDGLCKNGIVCLAKSTMTPTGTAGLMHAGATHWGAIG